MLHYILLLAMYILSFGYGPVRGYCGKGGGKNQIPGEIMLRIAVCDDEKNFCGELESYIVEYAKINREKFDLDVYYSGEELLEDLKRARDMI